MDRRDVVRELPVLVQFRHSIDGAELPGELVTMPRSSWFRPDPGNRACIRSSGSTRQSRTVGPLARGGRRVVALGWLAGLPAPVPLHWRAAAAGASSTPRLASHGHLVPALEGLLAVLDTLGCRVVGGERAVIGRIAAVAVDTGSSGAIAGPVLGASVAATRSTGFDEYLVVAIVARAAGIHGVGLGMQAAGVHAPKRNGQRLSDVVDHQASPEGCFDH